ncbi:hypothetical protein A6X21_03770 [Planctopirus hydrillae]|uniref:Uncharacterized protein n=1 Tax=Planctopirus hydrillae TaxID=1841610 RepID=A0A1C3ENF9_9PLAN|nr:hypothetical protein A6X21_03770 [Planctopirus hydrillae]
MNTSDHDRQERQSVTRSDFPTTQRGSKPAGFNIRDEPTPCGVHRPKSQVQIFDLSMLNPICRSHLESFRRRDRKET